MIVFSLWMTSKMGYVSMMMKVWKGPLPQELENLIKKLL